ncbi:MAG TPA: glycosyltransferase [Solirubrobacteraceae bacterium]|nr:glycosyltransferase [Solirubrobacteraceae bacterium]
MPLTVASLPPGVQDNPYLELLQAALRRRGVQTVPAHARLTWALRVRSSVQAAHLHWLELYVHVLGDLEQRWRALAPVMYVFRALRLLAILTVLRVSGVRLVWTVHNVRPHEQRFPVLDRVLTRAVAWLAESIVVHSDFARRTLQREYPWLRSAVWIAPHGHYVGSYPDGLGDRRSVRRELGIPEDAVVFLVFGQLRAYKGVDHTVRAFRALAAQRGAHLLVAGAPRSEAVRERIVDAAGGDPRVHLRLELVEDNQVADLHAAADAAVIAYPEVFSSGALLLALSHGLPVVAPRESSAADVAAAPALVAFEPGGLAEALSGMCEGRLAERRTAALATARSHSWDIAAARVHDAYLGRCPDVAAGGSG